MEGSNCLSNTKVFFLGASNVSKEGCALANYMGFKTVCVDEDSNKLNQKDFPDTQVIIVGSMESIGEIGISKNDMVCVITRGHTYDRQCFVYALSTDAFYVGMMGSAKKNAKCFAYALEHGISQEKIDWSHTPIGVDMDCSDAKEIALSIVTELVKVHNENFPRELDHDLLHQD